MSITSKKDFELLNYLNNVIDDYATSKVDYKKVTEKIYLIYRALELPQSQHIVKDIEDLWGVLKLIEANPPNSIRTFRAGSTP